MSFVKPKIQIHKRTSFAEFSVIYHQQQSLEHNNPATPNLENLVRENPKKKLIKFRNTPKADNSDVDSSGFGSFVTQ